MNMRVTTSIFALAIALVATPPVLADSADFEVSTDAMGNAGVELPPYLQCVPYARERTGVQIYGDALTWWDKAAGRYKRGNRPKKGAVMAFTPYRNMQLGHVAAVAKVIDSRTVLLDHANWSPINGRRGQIERGVKAVDVSPANDWSEVRVWYDPIQGLGRTEWPVAGFIYPDRDTSGNADFAPRTTIAAAMPAPAVVPVASTPRPARAPSREFLSAFADIGTPKASPVPRQSATRRATLSAPAPARVAMATPAPRRETRTQAASNDPISAALARYDR